jgi:hypothetical protein
VECFRRHCTLAPADIDDALVRFPRIQTQEDFTQQVLALFCGTSYQCTRTSISDESFGGVALELTAPPTTWSALLATVKAASFVKHLASVIRCGRGVLSCVGNASTR